MFISGIPGLMGLPNTLVRSVQQVSITIAAGSTSNTATITSVNTPSSVVFYGGVTGALTGTVNASTCCASIVLTNATTVTATRNTSDASNSLTVNATVIEFYSTAVKSVQTGSATMTASTSQTATITSVNTANAVVVSNGWTTDFTSNGANVYSPLLDLTNATTVTASRATGTNNLTANFTVLEFNSGILNSSTQKGTVAFGAGDVTKTATITSVTTGQAMIVWNGFNPTSLNNSSNFFPWLTLSDASTVTGTRNTSGVATNVNFSVLEFKAADIKSLTRGSITIAGSSASNTASISAVTTSKCIANFLGHTNGTAAQTNFAAGAAEVALTNSTTVTASRGTAGSASTETLGYETVEFK